MPFPYRHLALLLPLAAAVALGACSDREPEQPDTGEENAVSAPVVPDEAPPPPEPEAAPGNVQAAPKEAPPPEIPDDQQVLDDAAATGMTARLRRSGDASPEEEAPEVPAARKGEVAEGNNQGLGQIY